MKKKFALLLTTAGPIVSVAAPGSVMAQTHPVSSDLFAGDLLADDLLASDPLLRGRSDLGSTLDGSFQHKATKEGTSVVDPRWVKMTAISPSVQRQINDLERATTSAIDLITKQDLESGAASAYVRSADIASLIDEHTVHVKVNFDHRPVGGILNVQVSMTPSFRGIGISTRPAISKSIAQAVDQMDDAAIKAMIKTLTTEIKAEFSLMETEQRKD